MDLLARVASDSLLMDAWIATRAADAEDGYVARDVRDWERRVLVELATLKAELEDMTWVPEQVRTFTLADHPGRIFTQSTVRDRVVERVLSSVISDIVDREFSPFSFAYRKGLGHKDALRALRETLGHGWTHVVRTDVEKAFDSIPRRRLLDELSVYVSDQRVIELVARLLARIDHLGVDGIRIPQGSSLSPVLLNIYLDQLDRAVLAAGFTPIRYADDLSIPVSSDRDGLSLLNLLADTLDGMGLRVNSDKTFVVSVDSGFTFLGERITGIGQPAEFDSHVHPRRVVMYALGTGGVLRIRGSRVRLDRDGQTVASVPIPRLRSIVASERVALSRPLLDRACAEGIEVLLTDDHGGFVGRLSRRRGGDVEARRHQYRAVDDPSTSLNWARTFVALKIFNMRVAILREGRRRGEPVTGSRRMEIADSLERSVEHAAQAISVPALMGVEGGCFTAVLQLV